MILTFAEDFTSTIDLDAQLIATPDSGMFWNRGVHPLVTLDNLISELPIANLTFTAWDNSATYTVFDTSRKRSDVVTHGGNTYLSLLASDGGDPKTPGVDTDYWLETNENSLRIRAYIWSVEDNFRSALKLDRKLIENQYIYNLGETIQTLSNDYAGWAFEPKGSDYVKIRINQMSLQANTTDPVTVTVINQGLIKTTIVLNPDDGLLEFEDVGYVISGKGRFLFVFPSQEVLSDNAYNDPLKYDGFVCNPINGVGDTPEGATYSDISSGNGLNFNVSAYLDSDLYITNNEIDFAKFLQTQFEYDFLRMVAYNSNNNSNRNERNMSNNTMVANEIMSLDLNTVARKYEKIKGGAVKAVNKTFDKFLSSPKGFKVKRKVL